MKKMEGNFHLNAQRAHKSCSLYKCWNASVKATPLILKSLTLRSVARYMSEACKTTRDTRRGQKKQFLMKLIDMMLMIIVSSIHLKHRQIIFLGREAKCKHSKKSVYICFWSLFQYYLEEKSKTITVFFFFSPLCEHTLTRTVTVLNSLFLEVVGS